MLKSDRQRQRLLYKRYADYFLFVFIRKMVNIKNNMPTTDE